MLDYFIPVETLFLVKIFPDTDDGWSSNTNKT